MSLVLDSPLVVQYNGNDLNNVTGFTVLNRGVSDLPDANLRIHKLARTDGSILTTKEYSTKKLTIGGAIVADSRQAAEVIRDSLLALLVSAEGNIDITVAGNTRRWVGTLNTASLTARAGGYYPVSLEFDCSNPFGYDLASTPLITGLANTASAATVGVVFGGSYTAEPYIKVTVTAVTGGTGATVSLYNNDDGIGINVTRDWVAGDILEVDNKNRTVQVNGIDVNRTGRFFSFLPGSRTIAYSDTFATRTTSMDASYFKRYL